MPGIGEILRSALKYWLLGDRYTSWRTTVTPTPLAVSVVKNKRNGEW